MGEILGYYIHKRLYFSFKTKNEFVQLILTKMFFALPFLTDDLASVAKKFWS